MAQVKELNRAKKLIDECKLDEADQLIKTFEEKGEHTLHDIVLCHLLKCELLFERGLHEDVVKLAEQTYKESLGLEKNFLSVDILLRMAWALLCLLQTDKAHDIIKQGEELLKTLTQELPAEYKQREAYIAFLKGWVYEQKSEADQAIEQFEFSISLREELGVKQEIAYSLVGIADIFMFQKVDFDRALKYLKQGTTLAEESGNKDIIGFCLYYMARLHNLKGELDCSIMLFEQSLTIFNDLNNKFRVTRILSTLGDIYAIRGELNHSIRFYEQSLKLSKEYNYKFFISSAFKDLSSCYKMKGELDRALEYIEQSMALYRELGALRALAFSHGTLIEILVEMGDLKRAQISLRDLEQLASQLKDKPINLIYLLDKALVLKTSSRALNRGKAEELLKQILEDKDIFYGLKEKVLLALCELLLVELQMTGNLEVLEEVESLIARLLKSAEKSRSYWIWGETYVLQASLALITLDLKEARRLLTQGQKITEKYELDLLALKISNEHDELLKQQEIWEKLKESKAPLAERIELSRLNEQMDNMLRKRVIEPDEIQEEESVVILIISTGGTPIFTQSFVEGWSFQDHLFGGFLSAINSFSSEMFSQGLDRAIFGEFTILMKAISPFIICYLFKGQSFLAQQRMKHFIDTIHRDQKIWETIKNFYKANRLIQETDIPSLDLLVNKMFIERVS